MSQPTKPIATTPAAAKPTPTMPTPGTPRGVADDHVARVAALERHPALVGRTEVALQYAAHCCRARRL